MGLGCADAVLVFEELGRRLVPGPLVWSHLAAERIDGVAGGEVVVGGLDLVSAPDGPYLVEHLESLDALLALRADGIGRIDPKALDARPIGEPLDPLTLVDRKWRLDGVEEVHRTQPGRNRDREREDRHGRHARVLHEHA